VFLDEIGELPMAMQVKLLRVLEERQVWRVGSVKSRPIDALSRPPIAIDTEIARGAFRRISLPAQHHLTIPCCAARRGSRISRAVHRTLRQAVGKALAAGRPDVLS
jgi:transcriptional regulator of acetoin/glycerol metabolism